MKANEIMTGDYFRIAQTGKIIKIVAVDEPSGSVDYFDGDAGGALTISVEKIEPIPLTAEILEQNGFEEKTESNPFVYYLFKDGDNSVSLEHTYDTTDKEDYWACCIGNRLCDVCTISMHYIHELQHALRLCGIDKTIEML